MGSVAIAQVDADIALAFWCAQDDARIFLHPQVLSPLCEEVDWWLATWDGNPMCLWPMCRAADGGFRSPELSEYVGPLWHDAIRRKKVHRWWTMTQEIQRALLEVMLERYATFSFELPPQTRDVRAFQWFANDVAASASVSIECRHTAVITRPSSSRDTDMETALLAGFSRNRIRDVRDVAALGYRNWADPDPDALYQLYFSLLGGKEDSGKARRRQHDVLALVALAKSGFGRVLAYQDRNGLPASFALVLASRRTALPLLMASSDVARRDGLQAVVILQSMMCSFQAGADTFDFAGANSVVGAEEKHRYGAAPEIYFRVSVSAQ